MLSSPAEGADRIEHRHRDVDEPEEDKEARRRDLPEGRPAELIPEARAAHHKARQADERARHGARALPVRVTRLAQHAEDRHRLHRL